MSAEATLEGARLTYDTAGLATVLRRCPTGTLAAVCRYRENGDANLVPIIVRGLLARYVEPERRPGMLVASADQRLVEDLALDSLTLMELTLLMEDVVDIVIADAELRSIRTIGDVEALVLSKRRR